MASLHMQNPRQRLPGGYKPLSPRHGDGKEDAEPDHHQRNVPPFRHVAGVVEDGQRLDHARHEEDYGCGAGLLRTISPSIAMSRGSERTQAKTVTHPWM